MHFQVDTSRGKHTITLPNYYKNPAHQEVPYRHGVYSEIPAGPALDFWTMEYEDRERYCKDWMEWAYNNPFQPSAEKGKDEKYIPYLNASRANAAYNLGSMKDIWKDFAISHSLHERRLMDLDINEIEKAFWEYYIRNYSEKFEQSVKIFEDYIRERRADMQPDERELESEKIPFFADDENWIRGCRDYLQHLVYTSPRGYMQELILFAALKEYTGGRYQESSYEDERAGIDGYLVTDEHKYPLCVKPSSYNKNVRSPLYEPGLVRYARVKDDLVFVLENEKNLLHDMSARECACI